MALSTLLAKALFDNVAETPDELSFRKGDIMMVLEQDTGGLEGWWLCSLHGRQGIVPGNRLRVLEGASLFTLCTAAPRAKEPGAAAARQADVYQVPKAAKPDAVDCLYQAPVSVVEAEGVYQVPARPELQSVYQVPVGGPRKPPYTRNWQGVYQVPPGPAQCSRENENLACKAGEKEHNSQGGGKGFSTEHPAEKEQAVSPSESQVYDTPPACRRSSVNSSLLEEMYKTPRSTVQTKTEELEQNQEVYDVPSALRKNVPTNPIAEGTYDVPSSLMQLSVVASQPASPPLPPQGPSVLPPLPAEGLGDVYDVPPAFKQVPDPNQDVYAVPTNLKWTSVVQDVYEVPEDLLAQEDLARQAEENDIYDVPALIAEDSDSLIGCFSRLSASSSSSGQSKSSLESCATGRDSSLSQPMGAEPALDVVSAMETLSRLRQSVESSLAKLASGGPRGLIGCDSDAQETWEAMDSFQNALREFSIFARVAVSNSTQVSDPTLHVKLSKQLDLLEEAQSSFSGHGRTRDSTPASPKGAPNPTSDQLLSLAYQLMESLSQLASLIQGNSSLLFRRARLPSQDSLSRRPLPALPTPAAAGSDRHSGETVPTGSVRKGSIQDRPLPPPPVYSAEEMQEVRNEYEGIRLMEEYDYVHLQGKTSETLQKPVLSVEDRQILQFYADQCRGHYATLIDAMDALFACVQDNQPPKLFVPHGKFVIITAHKLVFIGDTLCRLASSQDVRSRLTASGGLLCQALKVVVLATKGAALQYPSVAAVQKMVDKVTELSQHAHQFTTLLGHLSSL
ncbi:breast cancer anti-estrogen resistance protein 1-like isoform X2 [Latimeria chalumnae]|uniref:breast cancer anti-estrogen resistance protein 1-like isoform X2 n=1 Tax=Latimeria chalumnae TaxID=7897 RepID=UPI00313CEC13